MFTCTLPLEALDAFTPTSSLSSWGWSCDFFRTKHMWRGWDIDAVTATPNKVESYKTSDNYNLIIIIWSHLFEG